MFVHDRSADVGNLGSLCEAVDHKGVERVGVRDGDVIVVDRALPLGRAANAAAVPAVSLGRPDDHRLRGVPRNSGEDGARRSRYVGIALRGPADVVRTLTKRLSLLR
jgi:hypothetical protein